jgi:peptide-methionine (R)-S-oxide reductase
VIDRRQTLVTLAVALGLGPALVWALTPRARARSTGHAFPITRSEADWRARLSPAAYLVLRRAATERAFSSPLHAMKAPGTYACEGCGRSLFASDTKFESGTGWPSFWRPMDGAVATAIDQSWLMVRTEVHCAGCGGHLGHVFRDGPPPTGLRYCINGVALRFVSA